MEFLLVTIELKSSLILFLLVRIELKSSLIVIITSKNAIAELSNSVTELSNWHCY